MKVSKDNWEPECALQGPRPTSYSAVYAKAVPRFVKTDLKSFLAESIWKYCCARKFLFEISFMHCFISRKKALRFSSFGYQPHDA